MNIKYYIWTYMYAYIHIYICSKINKIYIISKSIYTHICLCKCTYVHVSMCVYILLGAEIQTNSPVWSRINSLYVFSGDILLISILQWFTRNKHTWTCENWAISIVLLYTLICRWQSTPPPHAALLFFSVMLPTSCTNVFFFLSTEKV